MAIGRLRLKADFGSAWLAASAKRPNTKPNARWRESFPFVPSIPGGCADKGKVGAFVQSGIIDMVKQ